LRGDFVAFLGQILFGSAQVVFLAFDFVLELRALRFQLFLHAFGRQRFLQDTLHIDDGDDGLGSLEGGASRAREKPRGRRRAGG